MIHARSIDSLALDSYQRAARVILANHLVTRSYPDRIALPLMRRWATELREDLAELFGYRLEVTETTARLFPLHDRLEPGRPARTPAERVFDRRRYAYLALALAALGRAGDQITLSELADQVASYATRVDGLELATDRASDRDAFVDAVAWLGARGALTLADGDAGGWAADPEAGEALYDIDRAVVFAIFRPPRVLQHLESVRGLLDDESESRAMASVPQTRAAAVRRVRRALVERPVVYTGELGEDERAQLAVEKVVAEVELLTGLRVERRAEGVALIDTSGRFSDIRFPSTGTLAQVALLLVGEIADLVLDFDNPVQRRPRPGHDPALAAALDEAIPQSTIFAPLVISADPDAAQDDFLDSDESDSAPAETTYPVIPMTWISETVQALTHRYGSTFAAQWQADVPGLTREVLSLLERLRLIQPVILDHADDTPHPDDGESAVAPDEYDQDKPGNAATATEHGVRAPATSAETRAVSGRVELSDTGVSPDPHEIESADAPGGYAPNEANDLDTASTAAETCGPGTAAAETSEGDVRSGPADTGPPDSDETVTGAADDTSDAAKIGIEAGEFTGGNQSHPSDTERADSDDTVTDTSPADASTRARVAPTGSEPALLIFPALARYRGAVVTVRTRAESELFASATKLGNHAASLRGST